LTFKRLHLLKFYLCCFVAIICFVNTKISGTFILCLSCKELALLPRSPLVSLCLPYLARKQYLHNTKLLASQTMSVKYFHSWFWIQNGLSWGPPAVYLWRPAHQISKPNLTRADFPLLETQDLVCKHTGEAFKDILLLAPFYKKGVFLKCGSSGYNENKSSTGLIFYKSPFSVANMLNGTCLLICLHLC
jgi:hypothetical protein